MIDTATAERHAATIVGSRIRAARLDVLGIKRTQRWLSVEARISTARISELERGNDLPSWSEVNRISMATGRPAAYFVRPPAESHQPHGIIRRAIGWLTRQLTD